MTLSLSHFWVTLSLLFAVLALFNTSAQARKPFAPPETVVIQAGEYIAGSGRQERELGYALDEAAYGHSITRTQRWYESEFESETRHLPAYAIMKRPVTRCDYARFIVETDHPRPQINQEQWNAQRLKHPFNRTLKHQWENGSQFDHPRCQHPVVLVTHNDALAYVQWLSDKTGQSWRLPTEFEWEKAARGVDGSVFPWGNQFDQLKLNSHDNGPFDTIPVGSHPSGASPFGVLDMAGQVFEWTATGDTNADRYIVKGGSWDDKGCGVCRAAARHYRDKAVKHILIGFRLVVDLE